MKNKCVTSRDDTNRHTAHGLTQLFIYYCFFRQFWLCLIDLKIANDDDDVHSRAQKKNSTDMLYVFCWTDGASDFRSFFLFVLTHMETRV